jgi:CoA:oxalate CoA-transferase
MGAVGWARREEGSIMNVEPLDERAEQPLSGLTVLDLSHVYNGPYATLLMAMSGATVVKIEPHGGEHLRSRGDGAARRFPSRC